MAKGAPKGGKGKAAKGPVVGYGQEGKAFHNQANYNKSVEGQRHAKNPALSTKPVGYGKKGDAFFSKAAFNASKSGATHKTPVQPPGSGHAPPMQPHTPMPGHPSQNPTHYHGPATTGTIMTGGNPPRPSKPGQGIAQPPMRSPGQGRGIVQPPRGFGPK